MFSLRVRVIEECKGTGEKSARNNRGQDTFKVFSVILSSVSTVDYFEPSGNGVDCPICWMQ